MILVTGGAGYIGSHTSVQLLESGEDIVIIDNFANSHPRTLKQMEQLTGQTFPFYEGDVADKKLLQKIFQEHEIEAVLHFAGDKAVGESVEKPLTYYQNNLLSTLNLLQVMQEFETSVMIFSSSATVYGDKGTPPYTEKMPVAATNPYGRTKIFIEEIIKDLQVAFPALSAVFLRYFNPVGAHPSGLIGEDPTGTPQNLMPLVCQTAAGERENLKVFGQNYPTVDGTGVRDYIHVMDLATGHVQALHYARKHSGCLPINLGTGQGYSVLEMIETFERENRVDIPYTIEAPRAGDVASSYADITRAKSLLEFHPEYTLEDMCATAWKFWKKH